MVLVIVLYLLFSLAYIPIQQACLYAPPLFIVAMRMLFAGGLTVSFLWFTKKEVFAIKKNDWWLFGVMAICGICFANLLEVISLKLASPDYLTLLYTMAPFITALFSYFIFREKLTLRQFIGLGIGVGGVLPVILAPLWGCDGIHVWLADGPILGATVLSIIGWCVAKILITKRHYHYLLVGGVSMFLGGVLALVLSACFESWIFIPGIGWGYILLAALLANICAYNLYCYLLTTTSLIFVVFASVLNPIFSSLWSYLFLGKPVSILLYISLTVVSIGLGLFYYDELLQAKKRVTVSN